MECKKDSTTAAYTKGSAYHINTDDPRLELKTIDYCNFSLGNNCLCRPVFEAGLKVKSLIVIIIGYNFNKDLLVVVIDSTALL